MSSFGLALEKLSRATLINTAKNRVDRFQPGYFSPRNSTIWSLVENSLHAKDSSAMGCYTGESGAENYVRAF